MKKFNKILIGNNLMTNFKPTLLNDFKNTNNLKLNKQQIFCKNFLLYIILIKYNKKFKFNIDVNLFLKKNKNKVYTILRSPYRHKLARHQICLSRYFLRLTFIININNFFDIKNYKKILLILKKLKKINKIFETNLIYLENIKISIPIKFNNNFYITNFFKNK